jgi:chromate transporter
VLVLLACGLLEIAIEHRNRSNSTSAFVPLPLLAAIVGGSGGFLALVWVAFKVGALSYGGGFVIVHSCKPTPSTTATG